MKQVFKTVGGAFGVALLGTALFYSGFVKAQTFVAQPISAPVAMCTSITHNLGVGSRDYYTNGDVTALQNYLQARGYFNYQATGYYGTITARAVATWQRDNNIAAVGVVGPLTRAAIASASCNGGVVPPITQTPTIYSITPSVGPVGTSIVVTGTGFTNDNTILFGYGALVHVSAVTSIGGQQTFSFTVPSTLNPLCYYSTPHCMIASQQTNPGTYNISIQNQNGTSNSVSFTVTAAPTSVTPVIYRVTPNASPVGTTVSITGFGFTNDNTVHFGSGALYHVPITSSIAISCTTDPSCHGGINQTLQITIPEYLGPYCPPNAMCALWVKQITPGVYNISIQNDNGTSTEVPFTVQ